MSADKSYDLTYLKSISNDDEKFIQDMVGDFLTNTPYYFSKMEEALLNKDYETLYHLVHKFIPTLSFVGANEKIDSFELFEKMSYKGDDPNKLQKLFYDLKAYHEHVCDELKKDLNMNLKK
ncbi:MAG: Hpt domain-containing protein [Bacteroidota bacterium]